MPKDMTVRRKSEHSGIAPVLAGLLCKDALTMSVDRYIRNIRNTLRTI